MPFNIFKKYGYSVAENQTLLFMLNRFKEPIQYYEVTLAVVSFLGSCFAFFISPKKTRSHLLLYITLSAIVTVATFKIIRLESFWGLMVIPLVATSIAEIQRKYHTRLQAILSNSIGIMIATTLGFAVFVAAFKTGLYSPFQPWFGLGTYPGTDGAARFIKEKRVQGPIFNNYDVGGYLIYYLYPDYQVFVDNRPETYPVDFFADEYILPQEDPEAWDALTEKYEINVIVFYRHDLTNWGQAFLIARIQDENWIPVFVDNFSIIFVKNTAQNEDLIKLFTLPDEMFRITEN